MDMWRQPSKSWQPPELPTCCAEWSLVKYRFKRSRKFSVSCAPEKDGLRYYGPGTGLTPSDLRTAMRDIGGDFVLIGDSVTRQWFETLSCYLGAWESWKGYAKKPLEENYDVLEADITRTLLDFSERFRERGDLGFMFKKKDAVGFGAFQIPTSSEREIIQNVIVHNDCTLTIEETADLIIYYTDVYRRKFKRGKATIIINRGLHYNKNNRIENENKLRDDLRILMRVCADRNARCIFRESSPQHFTTSAGDGLFIKWNGEPCMKDPPATFQTLDRWRNDVLYDVVKEVVSRITLRSRNDGFVRVMPLFDRLSGLNHAHNGNEDCSHFFSDAEYWEPWHLSLTQVATFQTLDRWRNDVLSDVVKEVVSRTTLRSRNDGFVRVMPLFDRLSGLNHAHNGNEDCSHFYSDAEYWEPWHLSLTQVLTDIANTMNDVPLLYNRWVPRVKITPAGSESGSEETGTTTTTLNDLYADWLKERETNKSKGETPDPCSVDFLPFPHSEEDEQARKEFVNAIDPKKELGDILIFSRYRSHRKYEKGKTPIMFDFFDQVIADNLKPKDSPNPRSIYCSAHRTRYPHIENCVNKIMQLPALGELESGYMTKRILMVGNADGPHVSAALKQLQQLFDHKKISLALSESKEEFVDAIDPKKELGDILIFSRYRAHHGYDEGKTPIMFDFFDEVIVDKGCIKPSKHCLDPRDSPNPRSVYCGANRMHSQMRNCFNKIMEMPTLGEPESGYLTKRILMIGNDDEPWLSAALKQLQQLFDHKKISLALSESKDNVFQKEPNPFPHSEEDEQARKQFVDAIDPKKELGDILIYSRYCTYRGYDKGKNPIMFDFFDQLIVETGKGREPKDSPNPRSIYCDANRSHNHIKNCVDKIMQLPALGEPESGYLTKRILMVGNADGPRLSEVLKQLQQLFDHKKISLALSESKDIRLPKGTQITSVPFGFNKWYVDTIYGEQGLRDAILQASLQNKSKGVLAAWGAKWKELDNMIQSRKEATEFTDKSCLAPRQMIAGKDYLGTLSQYRFLLAPTGNGISTPKVAEALSVLTIPIVQRVPDGGYWDDLKELYGWPLAIVDKWDEITPENLQKWWVELAPQLNRARHNLLADRWWYQINHLDLE
eukprot:CAMPEP_0172518618 /NCGR_PEP_ID=MMETSP1066-20121228/290925_1 /TAXON_ID=671091 /ORGANISM="Coscinodiscus wailesii, Strain CCMP2513" /LENGTH=1119 /DNA_ID=CAMNT_0013301043 /DNA_START=222 /DNA_END=3583 /DNA_ORIENTATION=+